MRCLCIPVLLLGSLLLSACGISVPPEKLDYVGEWQSPTMYLLITQDGSVRYRRIEKGATTSVEGPLKDFDGDNFEVGIGIFATTFIVNRPPWEEEGNWKMVVDDTQLTRTSSLR